MDGGFGNVYRTVGVDKYYQKSGDQYANPHRYDIERVIKKKLAPNNNFIKANDKILDLACGSGEVTLPMKQIGYKSIQGVDPYTYAKYKEMTGQQCKTWTFVDFVNGEVDDQRYDVIIVSYALHLVKQSMLHDFCHKLAQLSKKLIIISPHKFPVMKQTYGWKQVHNSVMDRIHFRVFQSYEYQQLPEPEVVENNEK